MTAMLYDPEDITVPEGRTVEDLAWTAFSWDVHIAPSPGMSGTRALLRESDRFMQYVVAPGMMLSRAGSGVIDPWFKLTEPIPDGVGVAVANSSGTPMWKAIARTESQLKNGYDWVTQPFMFTMDPEDYPEWPTSHRTSSGIDVPMNSLGDILRKHGPSGAFRDVFNAALNARCEVLSASGVLNPYDV